MRNVIRPVSVLLCCGSQEFDFFGRKDKIIIFLILIIASAVFFNFLIGIGLLKETVKALMPMTFLGGILFGIGMVIAGGCTAGTLFRVGEGNVPSLIAAVGMITGMAAFGFIVASRFTTQLPHFVGDTTLISLHISPPLFSLVVAALGIMALGSILAKNPATKRKFRFSLTLGFVVALNAAMLNSLFYFSYSNCQEMSPFYLRK